MTTTDTRALPPPPHHLLRKASLFLDLDGTLIEIAARPDAVRIDDDLIRLLNDLHHALGGRVVIVSGRTAAEVRSLLPGTAIAVAGSHGAELRFADGREQAPAASEPPPHVLDQLHRLAAANHGVLIETKPFGLAIHYRLAPQAAAACEALAGQIAAAQGYVLQPGKMVIEIKYHSVNKGDAVRSFMQTAEMRAGTPLFIGDDLTDEAGFAAAAALGGSGVLVGSHRPTNADYRLPGVGAALAWLASAMDQLS